MTRELEQPTNTEVSRTLNVVNLISNETYNSLRNGNVIATSEGFAVKYSKMKYKTTFTGFLGSSRVLEEFMVLSPKISGGVLDLNDSDIVKYNIHREEEARLIEALTNEGIRQ